jgi:glycosyltransferase involved in cell wall biosynthesis
MHLALIYSAYPPLEEHSHGDGGADFCKHLVERLATEGHEIDVVTSRWLGPVPPEQNGARHPKNVHVHRIINDWGLRGIWKGEIKKLREQLNAIDPALILCVFPGGGLGCRYLLPALTKLICPKKPVVTMLFTFLVGRALHLLPVFLCAEALLLLTSKRICFESLTQMRRLTRLAPFLRSRATFISTGTTLHIESGQNESPNELRQRLGLSPQTKYVAFLGAFRRTKNVELFLRGFQELLARNRRIGILFIGGLSPDQMRTRYQRRMLRLIEQLGLEPFTRFTCYVDETTFLRYLRAADICVLPFDDRLGHSTLFAAMAAGRPIVTLTNGNHPFLTHGESAWLVEHANAKRLAQGIEEVLRDDRLRERLAPGALKASKQFSPEALTACWRNLLREVVPTDFSKEPLTLPTPVVSPASRSDLLSNGSP